MTKHKEGGIRADALQAELANDPHFQAMRKQRESKLIERAKLLAMDEELMVAELHAVGENIQTVWDLVNTKRSYPSAIPVLVRHLALPHHPWTRSGIARALMVPEAIGEPAAELVRQLSVSTSDEEADFRWCCAHALTACGSQVNVAPLEKLLRERSYPDNIKRKLAEAIKKSRKRQTPAH